MSEQPSLDLTPARIPLRIVPTPDREPGRVTLLPGHPMAEPGLRTTPLPPAEGQGTLALTFVLPSGVSSEPRIPRLRLLQSGPDEDADFGPQATGRADLPDPSVWAPRFLQAVLDVLAGDRPSGQLVRWTSEDVYGQVRRMARREGPTRISRARTGRRAAVRSTRVSEPADGVAEACATVRYLDRVRTVAFRFEGTDGRWRCTVLQFG